MHFIFQKQHILNFNRLHEKQKRIAYQKVRTAYHKIIKYQRVTVDPFLFMDYIPTYLLSYLVT
jgi:hypothetical protein